MITGIMITLLAFVSFIALVIIIETYVEKNHHNCL